MNRGKQTCRILKEIRQQIADQNDIAYITSECHFQGECKGTCPKCEAELRYLENELQKRKQLGKAAAIAGISLGIAGTFAALPTTPVYGQDMAVEKIIPRDTSASQAIRGVVGEVQVEGEMPFMIIEEMPEFPGGEEARVKYLSENMIYPSAARDSGIQGTIYVNFIIEKDGSISDVKVVNGIGGGCDEEAIRVVKMMPKWKPGRQRGKPVRV
ncbi:MAG: energy transducer TonB, partial [Bacteroidales bacterium]|nr:energy transducer TonB [Bacteroidales bacterium]